MPKINGVYWSRRYMCYVCDSRGIERPATVRIFSGIYGGEGFSACDEHMNATMARALRVFTQYQLIPVASNYEVIAYKVAVNKHGYPEMIQKLWTARRKVMCASSVQT